MPIEAGSAVVPVYPSLRGFGRELQQQITPELVSAGKAIGKTLSTNVEQAAVPEAKRTGARIGNSLREGARSFMSGFSDGVGQAIREAGNRGSNDATRAGQGIGGKLRDGAKRMLSGLSDDFQQAVKRGGSGAGDDAEKAGKAAGRRFSLGFKRTAETDMKSAGGGGGLFAGLLGGAGAMKAGIAGIATGAIGAGLMETINQASDLEESANKLQQIFAGATGEVMKFAEQGPKALGMTNIEARNAAATFGVFGKSAGLSGKELAGFSTQMTGLATDLASFHNTSPEQAIDAIGAAMRGEAEPMRQFGVLLDDATMRQEAMRMGLVKTTTEALTPQQKVLAAQSVILKQTKDAQGDFARTSGGFANQQRIFTATLKDTAAAFGAKLLPAATQALNWMNENLIPGMSRVADWLGPKLVAGMGVLGEFWNNTLKPVLVSFSGWIQGSFLPAFQAAVSWIQQNLIPWLAQFWQGMLVPLFAFLQHVWEAILKPILTELWNFISTKLIPIIQFLWTSVVWPIIKAIGAIIQWLWTSVILPVMSAVVSILGSVIGAFGAARDGIGAAWDWIGNKLSSGWEWMKSKVIDPLRDKIGQLPGFFEAAKNGISQAWNQIQDAVKRPVSFVVNTVIRDGIARAWNAVAEKLSLPTWNFSGVGFARGGWTGPGSKYTPAGVVHADEFVIRKESRGAIEATFPGLLDYMNQTGRMPGYADGGMVIPNPIGAATRKLLELPFNGLTGLIDGVAGNFGSSAWVQMMSAFAKWPVEQVKKFLEELITKVFPDITWNGGGGTAQWAEIATKALSMTGQPLSLLGSLLRRMDQESGGNPTAINNWDSNAAAGIPSKGLMQVIDPTFAAYRMPGYDNIWDPLSNILASIRYALARYGSLSAAYDRPGGYAMGGRVRLYDNGGYLPTGLSMVANYTGQPERVLNPDQEKALMAGGGDTINIYTVDRDNVAEVVGALTHAQRASRLSRRYRA